MRGNVLRGAEQLRQLFYSVGTDQSAARKGVHLYTLFHLSVRTEQTISPSWNKIGLPCLLRIWIAPFQHRLHRNGRRQVIGLRLRRRFRQIVHPGQFDAKGDRSQLDLVPWCQ